MFPSSGQRSAVPADCSQTNRQWPAWQQQQTAGQQTAAGRATDSSRAMDSRAADTRATDTRATDTRHQGNGPAGSQQPAASRATDSGQAAATGQPPAGRARAQKVGSVRRALFQSSTFRPLPSQFPANFDASVAPCPLPQPRKIWIRRRTGPVSFHLSVGPDGHGRRPDFGGTDASATRAPRTAA